MKVCILDNLWNNYMRKGQFLADSKEKEDIDPIDDNRYSFILADITSRFTVIVGIFFPSVTGKLITPDQACIIDLVL